MVATSASAAVAAPRRQWRLGPVAVALPLPLLLLLLPALAAAQCPISMTFYPPGTLNQPTAWSKPNQTEAGNDRDDALLPIALYGIPTPVLNAAPVTPVLGPAGTPVPDACATGGASVTRRRRRRQLSQQAGGAGVLAAPARYQWTWTVDGRGPPRAGAPGPAFNATTGEPVFPQIVLNEVWDLEDGPHTLTLSMVVAARSGSLADGTPVPSADLTVTRSVAFHKLTGRPTAKVAFDTCTPAFGIRMSAMWPDAIAMIDADGNPVPSPTGVGSAAFLRPVYHVWGRFAAGMDGKPFEGEDNDGSREWHFFDRYYVRELGAPKTLSIEKPDLAQGHYDLSVEGSLVTEYPSLVALAGADKYLQDGDVYTAVGPGGQMAETSLLNLDKSNGAYVAGLNSTRVGVQKARSALLALSGPDAPPAVGDRVEFSWVFQGLGNATCEVDGALAGNVAAPGAPPGACTSPYSALISDERNHTLAVTFRDVCGGAPRTERLTYGARRLWSTDAVLDGLASADSALALQDPMLGSAQLLQQQGQGQQAGERALRAGGARSAAGGRAAVGVGAAAVVGAAALAMGWAGVL